MTPGIAVLVPLLVAWLAQAPVTPAPVSPDEEALRAAVQQVL